MLVAILRTDRVRAPTAEQQLPTHNPVVARELPLAPQVPHQWVPEAAQEPELVRPETPVAQALQDQEPVQETAEQELDRVPEAELPLPPDSLKWSRQAAVSSIAPASNAPN